MSNTIIIDVPFGDWVDVSSTLSDDVEYSLQNIGPQTLRVIEKSTEPSISEEGFIIYSGAKTCIKPDTGFSIYAKSDNGIGRVALSEDT
jgi:hypothetical protein